MSTDPVLTAAMSHWSARFVANGVNLSDFEDVTASMTSYDEWCAAWSKRAALHEQIGREALAKKHYLTAGECLQRAGVYYHLSLIHISEPTRRTPISYAVFCLKKKKKKKT